MRVFFDTEFTHLKADAELISAGFVSERGDTFYAELAHFNRTHCSDFVRQVVLPLLDAPPERQFSAGMFAQHLADWLLDLDRDILLVSDSNWDSAVLAPAFLPFGGIQALVPGLRYSMPAYDDLCANRRFAKGYTDYFAAHIGKAHHALHDAQALRQACLQAEGFY